MRIVAAIAASATLVALASCDRAPSGPAGGGGGIAIKEFEDPERVVVEIESGDIGEPFEIADDAECSGGKCAVLAEEWVTHRELHPRFKTADGRFVPKDGLDENPVGEKLLPNGTVEVPFTVKKPGRYALWVRAWFHCGCGDSFDLSVDSAPPVDTDGDGKYDDNVPYTYSHSTWKRWRWVEKRGVDFDLAEGRHVLRIFNREDGIKLDQVFLQEIVDDTFEPYTPQGIEKPTP